MRPSWDEYFMLIAKLVSTRSTCNSRPTGAVLVKDRQILATGCNGSLPGPLSSPCSPVINHRRRPVVLSFGLAH
jgi:deoxycytidylate deaminase